MIEPYIGEIRMFAGDYAPQGWLFCNGATLSIAQNEALYSLIGTTYGGDGVTTFRIPDLRGRVPVHLSSQFVLGQMGGTETTALSTAELPAHSHLASANNSSQESVSTSPVNHFWGYSALSHYQESKPDVRMGQAAIGYYGSDMPHENMMPTMTTNFIIAVVGLYPV